MLQILPNYSIKKHWVEAMASVCPQAPLSEGVVILCWVGINKIKAAWSVQSHFSLTLSWVLGTALSIPGRPMSLKKSPQCFHSRRDREACCSFEFTPCLQSKVNAMKTGNSVPDTNACFRIDSDSRAEGRGQRVPSSSSTVIRYHT